MSDLRAEIDADTLVKVILVLVVAWLVLEVVESVVDIFASVLGVFRPFLGLLIVAIIVLWLLDRI